ncbi:HflK protein [Tepiditoga spiralis]|uniref:Protein HflK n=1 Tax=Tepiditoga spiralis TaxID=2108365 RepID=A0A7G1G720_9BACT|nr:FtsH protease activity modulator HflK [Tepiditoga spiralis]BBE32005.1 HflK protein [Tepiditoga spiralis]
MSEFEVFDSESPKKSNKKTKLFLWITIVVVILLYISTGIFQVGPSKVALIQTFGKYSYSKGPGIGLHLPFPFQTHIIYDIRSLKKREIGFRTTFYNGKTDYIDVPGESNMITGDENILSIQAAVQYRISDPVKLYFNLIKYDDLVKLTTESVLRERVALSKIDAVLTTERDKIAMETAEEVQKILNSYNAGINIENVYLQDVAPPKDVVEAFVDVNNAKQDKEKLINESQKYANDVIPRSQGQAEQILKDAEGYAYEKVALATGEAARFKSILKEYEISKEITKKRLILDAIDAMIKNSKLKIVSESGNTLKLLNLDTVLKEATK